MLARAVASGCPVLVLSGVRTIEWSEETVFYRCYGCMCVVSRWDVLTGSGNRPLCMDCFDGELWYVPVPVVGRLPPLELLSYCPLPCD